MNNKEKCNSIYIIFSKSISRFGNILFDYANSVWLVNSSINSSFIMAVYQSSESVIGIVFSLIGGLLSDIKSRKKILIISDIFSGTLCILLGSIFHIQLFPIVYGILFVNIILSILSSLSSPAFKGIIKEIVSKKQIGKLNSWLEVSSELTKIISPIISLSLVKYIGIRGALIINGLTFFVSALLTFLTSKVSETNKLNSTQNNNNIKLILNNFIEGFNYLYNKKNIFILVCTAALINFLIAGYQLYLPFSNKAFNFGNVDTYATFLSLTPLGGIAGALFSTKISYKTTISKLYLYIILCGFPLCAIYPLSFTKNVFITGIGIIFFNFFETIFNIQFMTYIQQNIDDNYTGRVFSFIFSGALLFMPFGTFFFEHFTNVYSSFNYLIIGFSFIIVSILSFTIIYILNYNKDI